MLIFIVLLYFLLACSLIGLAIFPAGRQAVWRSLGQMRHWGARRLRWAAPVGAAVDGAQRLPRRLLKFLLRHRWLTSLGIAMIVLPPLVAWTFGARSSLPGYEAGESTSNALVASLLKGEQLVPPVPLPPMVFSTQEVQLVRPMLADASRNWGLLHTEFGQRLLLAFKIMKEQHGYDMALLEGYRSPARQDMLASQGSHVSNAKAFQSYHQYGLAADCAFLKDGKLVISEKDPWAMQGYRLYGQVAESLGLTWGGRWTMMDFGHTELRLKGVIGK
jgi:peptidoglycan L-alanyl-D-glutamate endopeptidase CwlK